MNISYIAAAPADVNLLAIVYFVDLLCIFGFPVAP
jgi:hypothetical protein